MVLTHLYPKPMQYIPREIKFLVTQIMASRFLEGFFLLSKYSEKTIKALIRMTREEFFMIYLQINLRMDLMRT